MAQSPSKVLTPTVPVKLMYLWMPTRQYNKDVYEKKKTFTQRMHRFNSNVVDPSFFFSPFNSFSSVAIAATSVYTCISGAGNSRLLSNLRRQPALVIHDWTLFFARGNGRAKYPRRKATAYEWFFRDDARVKNRKSNLTQILSHKARSGRKI